MNLSQVIKDRDEASTLKLLHPVTGDVLLQDDKSPVTISLLSRDSSAYRNAQKAVGSRVLGVPVNKIPTMDDIEREALDILVAITQSWNGIVIDEDNSPLEFTPDNVRRVYKGLPWVKEQVEIFVNNRANFQRASS